MTAYISKQLNTKGHPTHLWVLVGIIVVLGCLYAYFLNAAIMSVVVRESLENNIAVADSQVGTLENQLLADERPLTADSISNFGLAIPKDVAYLNQEGAGTILTFGGNI